MNSRPKRRRRRRRQLVKRKCQIAIILTLSVSLITIAVALAVNALQETEKSPKAVSTTSASRSTPRPALEIDPNAGALITPTPAPTEPGVAIPGWGSVTIPAGVIEAGTSIKNPEQNEGYYYLTFELRMKDTGEVIFTTGLIPPGQYCSKVTLTRALEPGKYDAVVHVQPYRISDLSSTNNAVLDTVLVVE